MKHQNLLVVGGTGFIGRHLVARLAERGLHVSVATRRRPQGRDLWLLPTVDVLAADVFDASTLARLVAGQDAVINLVGILQGDRGSPYGRAFARAHVELPQRLVAACQAAGVPRLVHVSAIGAAPGAPSMYLRSKADGEAAIGTFGTGATILRPSVVFGPGDRFLSLFAFLQRWLPVVPLACADAHFQPVYVGDVARAIAMALDAPESLGRTYELGGPRIYRLQDLVRIAGVASGHARPILRVPARIARWHATLHEFLPGPTLLSRDNLDSMSLANIATGLLPGLEAPEFAGAGAPLPVSVEEIAPTYLGLPHTRHDAQRARAHHG